MRYLNLDPFSDIDLIKIHLENALELNGATFTDDDLLTTAMSALIEPQFDPELLVIVTDFPASQGALATCFTDPEGHPVAARFEIYHQNLELANGYQELSCPHELKKRFEMLNSLRKAQAKEPYPIDTALLEAMKTHFPPCCGVACGFDRLLMLALQASHIHQVQSLPSV